MRPCKTRWQQKWIRLDIVAPELQTLATEAEQFCARWFKNSPEKTLLVTVGVFGNGKTHTAKAIHRFCLASSNAAFETGRWGHHSLPSAFYLAWPEAMAAFEDKQFGLIQDAVEADLLILDDVGAENDPWKIAKDKLCQILSRREKKFTVVTTNIAVVNWETQLDGRINDRLLRNSVIVDISAVPSYSMR